MKQIDILNIVEELNNDLYDVSPELYNNGLSYDFLSNGWVNIVRFCDYCLYNSEMDSEEDVDNAGGLKNYIIQQKDKFIDMLVKVKST